MRVPELLLECLLVVAMATLLFVGPWLQGQVFGTFDLANITIALEDLFARYQAAGELPTWTPEVQGGFPMMANGFQSFFYPPHVILRAFLPGVWVANISLLLHLWLASFAMALLLRQWRFGRAAIAVGTLAFVVGGYFVGHITLPHLFIPAAWLPLIVWAAERLWEKPSGRTAALLGAAIGGQLFAGHVQMLIYTALLLLLLLLIHLAQAPKSAWWPRLPWLLLVPPLVFVLGAVHLLPLSELLPLSKRGVATVAEEAYDASYPAWQSLNWIDGDIFGHQEAYIGAKNEPELLMFFGVTGVLLGILGLLDRQMWRSTSGRWAVASLVVGALVAGGGYSGVYRWIHEQSTPLAGLANPGRAIILMHLVWPILMAWGTTTLLANEYKGRKIKLLVAVGVLLVLSWGLWQRVPSEVLGRIPENANSFLTSVAVVAMGWAVVVGLPRVPLVWRSVFIMGFLAVELVSSAWSVNPWVPAASLLGEARVTEFGVGAGPAPRIFSHTHFVPVVQSDFAPRLGPRLMSNRSIEQSFVAQQSSLESVAVQLSWNGQPARDTPIVLRIVDEAGSVVAQAQRSGADVTDEHKILFSWPAVAVSTTTPLRLQLTAPELTGHPLHIHIYTNIEGDYEPTGEVRACVNNECVQVTSPDAEVPADAVFTLTYAAPPYMLDRELLVPMFGEAFGYQMIRGHMQLQLHAIHHYMNELGERGDFLAEKVMDNRTLLDRFSVGWLATSFPYHRQLQGVPGIELVGAVPLAEEEAQVYKNTQAWPRIAREHYLVFANDVDQARTMLVDEAVAEDAVVVTAPSFEIDTAPEDLELIDIRMDTPTRMELVTDGSASALIVVRDVMYPGWQAMVDGEVAPILNVDSLFRGVVVPAGRHEVTFEWVSTSNRYGLSLSAVSWLILILYGGWYVWRTRADSH